ncbi:hypothetical protein V8E53_001982 [Lactarius tabidus]
MSTKSFLTCIVYLFCGRLPWQDIKEGVEQYEEAILKKKTTLDKVLCQGLPLPFVTFALHIQSLGFNEKPQYNYLCALLMQCLVHDPNDVVSEHTTLLHSPCKLSIPTTLPRDQQIQTFALLVNQLEGTVCATKGYSFCGLIQWCSIKCMKKGQLQVPDDFCAPGSRVKGLEQKGRVETHYARESSPTKGHLLSKRYTASPLTQAQPMDPSTLWNAPSRYPTWSWWRGATPPNTVLLKLPLLCAVVCRWPVDRKYRGDVKTREESFHSKKNSSGGYW